LVRTTAGRVAGGLGIMCRLSVVCNDKPTWFEHFFFAGRLAGRRWAARAHSGLSGACKRGGSRAIHAHPQITEALMTDRQVLANQKTIIANQKTIIANQKTIVANQRKLNQVLANQKKIEGNQKKILENQAKILAK
jgi:hypothetical protein